MKKIILILAVLFSTSFILAGCGESVNDENFIDEPVSENFTGVLNELDYSAGVKGSHSLKIGAENIMHLRSTSINLSNEEYLGNVVNVIGVKNDDLVFNVTSISVIEEIVSHKIDFIDYINDDFGIQMKYYSDMEIVDDGNMLSFIDVLTGSDFRITQNAFNYSGDLIVNSVDGDDIVIESPLQAFFILNYPEVSNYEPLLVTAGKQNLEAVRLPGGIIDFETAYFIYRSGLVYEIDFYLGEDVVNEAEVIVKFKTMLSEFDFTIDDVVSDCGDGDGSDDLSCGDVVVDEFIMDDDENPIDNGSDGELPGGDDGFEVDGDVIPDEGGVDSSDSSGTSLSDRLNADTRNNVKIPSGVNGVVDLPDLTDFVLPEIDMGLSIFESSPYNFAGSYPSNWYYSGTNGGADGVLRHYGFTDSDEDNAEELVSVDVISVLPAGRSIRYDDFVYIEVINGDDYSLSVDIDGRILSVYGDVSHTDLILNMATSLSAVSSANE